MNGIVGGGSSALSEKVSKVGEMSVLIAALLLVSVISGQGSLPSCAQLSLTGNLKVTHSIAICRKFL